MSKWIRNLLAKLKDINPATLEDWKSQECFSFCFILTLRMIRGVWAKYRLGEATGMVLAEKRVRLIYPRMIRAGRSLNLEEGCEIVGLSKRGINFGDRCTVGRFASIRPTNVLLNEAGEGLKMGDHSNIGPYSWIGCSGYVEIGDNVMMGPRVNLLAENHRFDQVNLPMKDQGIIRDSIFIEDDCWLGAGCSILAGVRVGKGSIVAAGAVVTKDVPSYSIVGGVPAKLLKRRS